MIVIVPAEDPDSGDELSYTVFNAVLNNDGTRSRSTIIGVDSSSNLIVLTPNFFNFEERSKCVFILQNQYIYSTKIMVFIFQQKLQIVVYSQFCKAPFFDATASPIQTLHSVHLNR